MRPVTSSSRTSNAAGTKPTGVVSIDGSTAMAGVPPTINLSSGMCLTATTFPLAQHRRGLGFCTCSSFHILRCNLNALYHTDDMQQMTLLLRCADSQQTQGLRNVTPSSYAPLAQTHGASGSAATDQATVGPVRPVSVRLKPFAPLRPLDFVSSCLSALLNVP